MRSTDRTVITGERAATELVEATDADVVLNGITGSIGLEPTLAALHAGRTLALANKESLVAGGALVTAAAAPGQIVPVDSEHSALAQCLRGGAPDEVARLVVTASGGPFRGRTAAQLADVTAEQALAHPTWAMGPVVTINSATLVNKGLEVIEAHLLFDIPYDRIDVVVHPQSVIHSMVTFVDGSTMAQASPPDMRLPIALGLAWPDRLDPVARGLRLRRRRPPGRSSRWTARRSRRSTWPAPRGRAGRHGPGRIQRRQRGGGGRLPHRSAAFHRHLRRSVRASWTRPAHLRGATRGTSRTSWPRRSGPGAGPARSSPRDRPDRRSGHRRRSREQRR